MSAWIPLVDYPSLRGNLISLEMKVTLGTYPMGKDDHGIQTIGFGFEPAA